MAYILGGDYQATPGIQVLHAESGNANRAKAAAKALEEQEPGSEFTIQMPGDAEAIFARLEEIRTEMGELYNKLYATSNSKRPSDWMGYGGPIYQVRIAIQDDLDKLSLEETQLQRQLQELRWALPPNDQNGDEQEDAEDLGDATQPIQTYKGTKGSAKKVISTDANGGT